VVAAALIGLAISGCMDARADDAGDRVDAFPGSAVSLDRLGEDVLDALVLGDVSGLERFRLTESEHNDVVWPELPASAPEVNFPLDYAWANIENRNRRALGRIAGLLRGEDLRFGRVECRGATESFETFEVLTDCWVVFERRGDREAYEMQIFKDVLVRGGGYKIFRYYDEQPRRYSGNGKA
jgi:hypothetical protein